MNQAPQASDLVRFVKTHEEALHFMGELDQLRGSLYTTQGSFEEKANKFLPYDKKDQLLHLCAEYKVDASNMTALKEFLDACIEAIQQAPIVALEVALSPTDQTVSKLLNWLRIHVAPSAVIDIQVNKTLIGGATIACKGKFVDYSVKKKLQESSL